MVFDSLEATAVKSINKIDVFKFHPLKEYSEEIKTML